MHSYEVNGISVYIIIYILVVHAFSAPGDPRATCKCLADQRSLKLPRKRLISYLTLSGKTAATAMDKELNTR